VVQKVARYGILVSTLVKFITIKIILIIIVLYSRLICIKWRQNKVVGLA